MPKVEVQLILNVEGHDGLSERFEQSVDSTPTADGMKYFIEEGVNSLRAELLYGDFYEHLPSTEGLFPVVKERSYTSNDLFSGKIENETNKQEIWRFVANNAHAINAWLAKAKSIQEVQRSIATENDRLRFILQFEKMDKLHLAVHAIANLRDIHKRIVMEGLGGVRFDIKLPSGQTRPARSLKEALENRADLQAINDLDAHHISVLEQVAGKLEKNATTITAEFLNYKSKLGHDAPQIVDDPLFYPQLDDRKWTAIAKDGKEVGKTKGIFSRRTRPDWMFDDIHRVVVDAFQHYLDSLQMLRSLDTFNPD